MNLRLRSALLKMARDDQAMRLGKHPWRKSDDIKRAKKLTKLVRHYGWPNKKTVGTKGLTAAWLIAQHADFDHKQQVYFLEEIKKATQEGSVPIWQRAYLEDRVRVNQGRRQLYGTQFRANKKGLLELWPVQNRKQLDVRRKGVGLEPISIYCKRILSR